MFLRLCCVRAHAGRRAANGQLVDQKGYEGRDLKRAGSLGLSSRSIRNTLPPLSLGLPERVSTHPVGVGWRREIASQLMLGQCPDAAFFEVVAEACLADPSSSREVEALVHRAPVIPHGVKLSLGSAEGIDPGHVDRIAGLCKRLRAPCFTEHVAFVRSGGTEIGHLTPLPRTREALRVVARNVEAARRRLPDIPLLLENVANTFFWPGDEMTEAEFYQEVVRLTGCDLLLDLSNLYANARNQGLDPQAVLAAFPLERVRMAHVAGGVVEDCFYLDTHAHAVPQAVFGLVTRLLHANPTVPLLLERDANFDGFDLASDMQTLAQLRAVDPPTEAPVVAKQVGQHELSAPLAELQHEVAQLLTAELTGAESKTAGSLAAAIGDEALARSRTILERKRVEDALPLLPRLSRAPAVQALAERVIRELPRMPARNAHRDALAIGRAASEQPALSLAAELDRLLLRARVHETTLAPRRGPFLGVLRQANSWYVVAKGFGASSTVHLWSRGREAVP